MYGSRSVCVQDRNFRPKGDPSAHRRAEASGTDEKAILSYANEQAGAP